MNIHKRTRLTLSDRQEIWWLYQTRLWKVANLAECTYVSSPTIYGVLKRARLQEFTPLDSTNQRLEHCSTVSSEKPSAITSLTRASLFTSIPQAAFLAERAIR
ncbi:hypothetical protein [Nitrosomonas sp.]|uniref:hypothetical protein n=1 Tax=Nitrosomonas sp. TaxID=42353 RepID=UPI0032EF2EFB